MRNFIMKWKAVIIWFIAILFTLGIVWMGVASYMGMGGQTNQSGQDQEYVPNRSEALAVITKDSTDLAHEYWVMPYELSQKMEQVKQMYQQYNMNLDELFQTPYVRLDTAKSMVDNKIVAYYADQNGLDPSEEQIEQELNAIISQNINTDQIKQAVINQFGSIEGYKEYIRPDIEQQIKINNVKDSVATVTEADVKVYFDNNKEQLLKEGNQVKVAHILVEDLSTASDVLAEIEEGQLTFTEAASAYSMDQSNSQDGGELGWISKGEMVPEFEEAAFNGEVGTIEGPVQTQYGYHLLNIEDKKSLENFEDFKTDKETYESAVSEIKTDEYNEWLAQYKEENKFTYIFNDDVLNTYDKYQEMTADGEKTDIQTLKHFIDWIDQFIVVEEDGEKKIDREVDPRIISLYVSVNEQIKNNLENQKTMIEDYMDLSKTASETLANKEVETLEAELADIETSLENAMREEDKKPLKDRQSAYEEAIELKETVADLKETGIGTENLESQLNDLDNQIEERQGTLIAGLRILYDYNTASSQVVNMLHKYDPDNTEVTLKWLQTQIQQYTQYMNDEELFSQYRQMLEPQLFQLQMQLLRIAQDEELPQERRVTAYEVLLNLLEKWGKYEEEVKYLKELKALEPDYPDIDEIIQQVEAQVNAQKEAQPAEETETDPFSTVPGEGQTSTGTVDINN